MVFNNFFVPSWFFFVFTTVSKLYYLLHPSPGSPRPAPCAPHFFSPQSTQRRHNGHKEKTPLSLQLKLENQKIEF
jgi:hypothetical protein